MSAEDKLKAMGLVLPATPKPLANYVSYKKVGDLVFLSGKGLAIRTAALPKARSAAMSQSSKPMSTPSSSGSGSSLPPKPRPARSTRSR